jgi:hypothetical protein
VVLASLIIADCSLAVSSTAGLSDRKRPFSLLRLTGVPLSVLRRVVGKDSLVNSVACFKAGSCVAVGHYEINPHLFAAFAVTYSNGKWGRPGLITAVPPGAANGSVPTVDGISCPTSASCLAAGGYAPAGGNSLPMVVVRSKGSWRPATGIRLPANAGGGTLRRGFFYSVACWKAGRCFAVGYYTDSSTHLEAMAAASR